MKRSKTWIACILCGLACLACVVLYLQSADAQVESARAEALERYGGEQLEVCVAAKDIAAGETVDASALESKLWVADLLPEDPVFDPSEVVGKQASATVLKGEVVSLRRFEGSSSGIDVPSELSAVSVPARDVQTVGAALRPGMEVDVYATAGSSTSLIAQSVLVLATNASASSSSDAMSWVTLAVAPSQVQEIVTVAQTEELYFVLPGADVSSSAALGADEPDKAESLEDDEQGEVDALELVGEGAGSASPASMDGSAS